MMSIHSICILAFSLYLLGAIAEGMYLSGKRLFSTVAINKWETIAISLTAAFAHSYILYRWIDTPMGQNLCLSHMFSLVCWLISTATLFTLFFKPMGSLAIFILPLTALSIPVVSFFPSETFLQTRESPATLLHILISIAAFGLLGMATLQATWVYLQNRLIRNKSNHTLLRILPPLQTMETLMFQMIGMGFIFLSASLITAFLLLIGGGGNTQNEWISLLTGYKIQKIIFSVLSWALFAALLYGRYQTGLRGQQAIRYTLMGVGFLMIAYLGSK